MLETVNGLTTVTRQASWGVRTAGKALAARKASRQAQAQKPQTDKLWRVLGVSDAHVPAARSRRSGQGTCKQWNGNARLQSPGAMLLE